MDSPSKVCSRQPHLGQAPLTVQPHSPPKVVHMNSGPTPRMTRLNPQESSSLGGEHGGPWETDELSAMGVGWFHQNLTSMSRSPEPRNATFLGKMVGLSLICLLLLFLL